MQAFALHYLEYFCHSLLAYNVSVEKSAASLIGFPSYFTSCFSFAAFKILSLSLKLGVLIMMCLGLCLFEFILFGASALPECAWLFPSPGCGHFLSLFFSNRVSITCSFSSPSGIPMIQVLCFM